MGGPRGLWMLVRFIGFVLMNGGLLHAQAVNDPERDFVRVTNPTGAGDLQILKIRWDAQGREAWLYSWVGETDGKAGNIWTAYVPDTGGYRLLDEPLEFRPDCYFIGEIAGRAGQYLVTYTPGSSKYGEMTAYRLGKVPVEEVDLGRIEPLGKDSELYQSYFAPEVSRPTIETIKREKIAKKYEESGLASAVERPSAPEPAPPIDNRKPPAPAPKPLPEAPSPPVQDSSFALFGAVTLLAAAGLAVLIWRMRKEKR